MSARVSVSAVGNVYVPVADYNIITPHSYCLVTLVGLPLRHRPVDRVSSYRSCRINGDLATVLENPHTMLPPVVQRTRVGTGDRGRRGRGK